MKVIYFILLLIMTIPAYSYQEKTNGLGADKWAKKGLSFFGSSQYDSAQYYFIKARELYKEQEQYGKYMEYYNNVFYTYFLDEQYDTIITLARQLLVEMKAHYPESKHAELANTHNYLGLSCLRKDDLSNAHKHYQKNLSIIRSLNQQPKQNALWDLSQISATRGDYHAAKAYLQQYLQGVAEDDYLRQYDTQMELTVIHGKLAEFELALAACDKAALALEQADPNPNKPIWKSIILHNRADIYHQQKNELKAIALMKEAMKIPEIDLPYYSSNLGKYYVYHHQYDSANRYLYKSLKINQQYEATNNHFMLGSTHIVTARMYLGKAQYDSALYHAQRGIVHFLSNFDSDDVMQNPALEGTSNQHDLKIVLHYKAKALIGFGLAQNSPKYYQLGIQTYLLNIELLDQMRSRFDAQGSKIALAKTTWEFFEDAIDDCLRLYEHTKEQQYLELAWKFSEHSKSELLKDAVAEITTQHSLGVGDSIISLEHDLKVKIEQLNSRIYKAKKEAVISSLQAKRFALEGQLNELKKNIEVQYPNYHQLKYQDALPALSKIQDQLTDNQAIIQYFVGDQQLYVFHIEQQRIQYHRIDDIQSLGNHITKLRESLSPALATSNAKKSYQLYTENGVALYQQILQPVVKNLAPSVTQLTIIPDGQLSYIPFELLLSSPVASSRISYATLPYVLQKYQINYAYRTSFQQELGQLYGAPKYEGVLAFAPAYTAESLPQPYRSQLNRLVWNTQEVEQVEQFLPTTILKDQAATKAAFQEKAPDYAILHLAMHALVDNDYAMDSKLAFSASDQETSFLNLYELYGMKLRADLVVLSACNSGYGQYIRGEGIASLGRAFAYAGCPNVVMSHWPVDDESTANLMTYFYQALSEGKTKAAALKFAKIQFLSSAEPREQHPVFWGGFILIGDDGILESTNTRWWWALPLLLLVGIGSYMLLRRRNAIKGT